MKKLVPAIPVAGAATACSREVGFKPVPVSFAAHPSVLRGAWSADVSASQALKLQLTATDDTTRQYQVSGTGSLGSEALTVSGSVAGGSYHSYLKAQLMPAPEMAQLTLQRSGLADLKLRCFAYGNDAVSFRWAWQCSFPDTSTSFKLTKEAS
ncbi:hypothetical protein [Deinococcus alpinitundrae]|uniref:hypothetical protein n=1 Tax=Deinococcus alpinitundrae TaxID=468913 RepID=UPI00137AD0AB|nr:hypothetical protein [Deinococcus alpinitundrae]